MTLVYTDLLGRRRRRQTEWARGWRQAWFYYRVQRSARWLVTFNEKPMQALAEL